MARYVWIVAAGLLMVSGSVAGEVYRCEGPGGELRFSDVPCAEGKGEKLDLQVAEPSPMEQLIAQHKVAVGMTEAEVQRSWGPPDDINTTIRQSGRREQWVYDRGDFSAQYVYFENGQVTSISSN